MKKNLLIFFLGFLYPLFSLSEIISPGTSSAYGHKHKKKHHRPYNHCPVKRGTDKKLVGGYYIGTASFYHSMFNGRKTSNGDRFSSKKMTAAHRTLRLGSYVEVTNLRNHKIVYVKINDRLPPHSCRMIDLTRAAAFRLKMVHQGLAKVRIKLVNRTLGKKMVKEEMEQELARNNQHKKG